MLLWKVRYLRDGTRVFALEDWFLSKAGLVAAYASTFLVFGFLGLLLVGAVINSLPAVPRSS